ncbi:glycosyltransferase [Thiocystis violacea]|uniref:glycosyltransferase n=1 Tax=Thiocystis violacea TaxID=13725 RepID=UPI001907193B|nr:glycosyltransferase [Thiocystis violacea]MBK1718330.1 hypothetical protein [Thiocystis violacea]
MRILHLVDSLDPAAGGPPAVALRLAAAQAAIGHDASVVGYCGNCSDAMLRNSLASIPFIDRTKVHILPAASRLERLTGFGIPNKLSPLLSDTDILQIHGLWEQLVFVGARLAQRSGIPYVVTPHGMLDHWSMAQRRLKKRLALAIAYRRFLDHARYLHVLNTHESNAIKDLGIFFPMETIPNGIFMEENESRHDIDRFRSRHPYLGQNPYILFLGRLHYKKGLDYLIDAFHIVAARNESVQLVVIGPDGGERDSFQARVRKLQLTTRVHMVEAVYGADKYDALHGASCFCLPSRQEGSSLAVLEAMSCGIPVVISEACHFPDVADSNAGFVVPLVSEIIAQALISAISDDALRERMGCNGKSLVKEKYTWTAVAKQCVDNYERYLY